MIRFFHNHLSFHKSKLIFAVKICSIGILLCIVFSIFDLMLSASISKQKEQLEASLHRNIIQCYALEGIYPPDLDYLKEHYGLEYDDSVFFIDYQPIALNIMPDYTVLQYAEK